MDLPDEKRIKKACNQSPRVVVYAYGEHAGHVWWRSMQGKVASYKNLSVRFLDNEQLARLTALANRNLQLQASLQEGTIWLSDAQK